MGGDQIFAFNKDKFKNYRKICINYNGINIDYVI